MKVTAELIFIALFVAFVKIGEQKQIVSAVLGITKYRIPKLQYFDDTSLITRTIANFEESA